MEWWILRILWIFPLTWKSPNSSVFLIESHLQSQLQYILWLGAHFLAEGHSTSGKIPSSDMFACWYSVPKCVQLFVTPWIVACQASLSFSLMEFAQIHVHWVKDTIQPSHPLSPPSHPAFNPCQHQGLFQWAVSSHQVPKILELQHQSVQWIFRTDFL